MPEMKIKPAFALGQIVYLKADPDQYERIVTGIHVYCSGFTYELRHSDEDYSTHSFIEISEEKRKEEI
jgi:hypothetical protein